MSDEIIQTKPFDILVTGSTGFIGKKLLVKLTESGYTVKAIKNSSS